MLFVVRRLTPEPQPGPLCVMLQRFKRLGQPAGRLKTLSAPVSLSVSIVSTVEWRVKHVRSVCMCVRTLVGGWVAVSGIRATARRRRGESTAAELAPILPPHSLLCDTKRRKGKCAVIVRVKMFPDFFFFFLAITSSRYLLNLSVRSFRGTDLAARAGRLVDKGAGGTRPLCLLKSHMCTGTRTQVEFQERKPLTVAAATCHNSPALCWLCCRDR